jgi:hypothetical protein
MKSLASIIDKLSPDEIETFRAFLASNSRTLKNKKLELFNTLADRKKGPKTLVISRQSAYQLKKRLQEQLYSFLVSQEQIRTHDQLFLEMDCHRKLYCFKILFDKGIHDHAYQLLREIMSVSEKHALHSIYLDAVNLRNTCFPLKKSREKKNLPISGKIEKLTNTLERNLYINQYLACSSMHLHDSDRCFRESLMRELAGIEIGEGELVIERLLSVNKMFFDLNFNSAHQQMLEMVGNDFNTDANESIHGLIYIELIKSHICIGDLGGATKWMDQSQSVFARFDSFTSTVLELEFIVALRSDQMAKARSVMSRAESLVEITTSEVLNLKWAYYSLVLNFCQRRFRDVIKAVNANPAFSTKIKNALVNIRFMEIVSVFQVSDWDWLLYKVDNFRKTVNGLDEKFPRILQVISMLKAQAGGRIMSHDESHKALSLIENEFPWHPLSLEIIRVTDLVQAFQSEAYPMREIETASAFS